MTAPHLERMVAAAAASALTGLVVVPLVIAAARRFGMVAKPRADRWSSSPTALLGGIGIYAATIAGLLVGLPEPFARPGVWAAAFVIFATGLWDDIRGLPPQNKLLMQIVAACIVLAADVRMEPGWHPVLGWALSLLFIVGIINAVNLLDNMDGLAAGIALVSAGVLAYGAHFTGNPSSAIGASALLGACLAFLVFNRHPAKVFMGDCGSMFLGLCLAVLAIQTSRAVSEQLAGAILVPGIALAVPIFDTAFVTVVRRLNGRAISEGGCDHTSHRLVKLGLSEQQAVGLLWVSSLAAGALGVAAMRFRLPLLLMAGAMLTVFLLLAGKLLAKAQVYEGQGLADASAVIDPNRLHKRHLLTVLVDALLALSAGLGVQLLAQRALGEASASSAAASIPFAVAASVGALGLLGAYRDPWRRAMPSDTARLAAGTGAGALVAFAVMAAFGLPPAPAAGLGVCFWSLLLAAVAGSRAGYRKVESIIAPGAPTRTAEGAGLVRHAG